MDMTLESLLNGLEQQVGITKLAADESEKKEDDKEKKEEDKKEDGKESGKSESDSEKSEKSFPFFKKKEEEKEQTKEAQEAGAALVAEIMQKVASLQVSATTPEQTSKEPEMNKQASVAGKALADALLEKLANAGDQTTVAGIPEGVAPNKNQIDNAQLVAEQDSTIKPMPTGDGIKNTGSINQIFDAIVADALGQGAASTDQVHTTGVAAQEGAVEAHAVPNQVKDESVEKSAAVASLVNSGIDFDSAVNMVKAAAEEIAAEEAEQVKQAALSELVGKGVDFDLAVALVKSAGLGSLAQEAGAAARNLRVAPRMAAESLAKNRLVQGVAAGGAAAGAAGLALHREKKAAFDALCEAGVDFETAAGLVQSKAQELYGA